MKNITQLAKEELIKHNEVFKRLSGYDKGKIDIPIPKRLKDIVPSLKEKGTDKIKNERQLVIKDFLDALNYERAGTEYKKLTAQGVAVKVGHLSTQELKMFYKQCNSYKGAFGKIFFGALRVNKK